MQTAIATLQSVLSADFKATDIEVCAACAARVLNSPSMLSLCYPGSHFQVAVVRQSDRKFKLLTDAEVENHLTAISERD